MKAAKIISGIALGICMMFFASDGVRSEPNNMNNYVLGLGQGHVFDSRQRPREAQEQQLAVEPGAGDQRGTESRPPADRKEPGNTFRKNP